MLTVDRFPVHRIAAALLSLFVSHAVFAAVWIAHVPAHPAPGEAVTLRLMEGEPFDGAERAHRFQQSARFQHLWKGGRSNLSEGAEAIRIRPAGPGVQLLAYSTAPTAGQGSFRTHHAKTLVVVGDAAPASPLRWSELGQRLEIVPQSDPVQLLRGGGELAVQVLWEREPLAGVAVEALLRGGSREATLTATTDEIGVVRFDLQHRGFWVIRVELDTDSGDGPVLASATLGLMARGAR